jgi:hypothetical protein
MITSAGSECKLDPRKKKHSLYCSQARDAAEAPFPPPPPISVIPTYNSGWPRLYTGSVMSGGAPAESPTVATEVEETDVAVAVPAAGCCTTYTVCCCGAGWTTACVAPAVGTGPVAVPAGQVGPMVGWKKHACCVACARSPGAAAERTKAIAALSMTAPQLQSCWL